MISDPTLGSDLIMLIYELHTDINTILNTVT